jgi:phosphate-selective porin OprO/OprP
MKKVAYLCVALLAVTFTAVAQETGAGETVTNITGTSNEGLTIFESGKFKLQLDGRLQMVGAIYSGSINPLGSGTEVRRARLALSPTWGDWSGQFDLNFAGNAVEIKDFWVAYNGFSHFIIKAGNHKTQWSLEEVTSSRYITFIERASMNGFTPDRRMGLSVTNWHKNWRIFAGVFGQGAEDVDETGEKEAVGYNFRLTTAPLLKKDNVIHIGASFAHERPSAGSGDRVKFNTRPESHVTMAKFLTTGNISNVQSWDLYGLEFATVSGPVLVQAEYSWVDVNRVENPAAKFKGYYGYAAWNVTGEKRPYNSEEGEVGYRTIPKKNKLGAIELAVRYSCMNLDDTKSSLILGGKEENFTFAANWFPYANLKFSLNYALVKTNINATGGGDYLGGDKFNILSGAIMFLF